MAVLLDNFVLATARIEQQETAVERCERRLAALRKVWPCNFAASLHALNNYLWCIGDNLSSI